MSWAYRDPEVQMRTYLETLYDPADYVAVMLRKHQGEAFRRQRIVSVAALQSERYLRWLRYQNASGASVYLSLNPVEASANGRTKQDVAAIRTIGLDLDEGGRDALNRVYRELPAPTTVVRTSTNKFQVVWRLLSSVEQDTAETLMRSLAEAFGADRACVDVARVFRPPGFSNPKYGTNRRREWCTLLRVGESVPLENFGAWLSRQETPTSSTSSRGRTRPDATSQAPSANASSARWFSRLVDELALSGAARTKVWRAWQGKILRDRTASERDWMLAGELAQAGATDRQIRRALTCAPNRQTSRGHWDVTDYLERTITNVRHHVQGGRS